VKKEHYCQLLISELNYVVLKCYEANGNFWIKTNLFGERVNYCPICGQKAPNQIKDKHELAFPTIPKPNGQRQQSA
jgi:hypothetical protein